MEYRDEKRRLLRELIASGATQEEFKTAVKNAGVVAPTEMLKKWESKFYAIPTIEYSQEPRLVNRFSIGADPEFAFMFMAMPYDPPVYVYANRLGLHTLNAFGADMSGRQAELRVWPSRSALEVTASILDTLRWMNEHVNYVEKYDWIAPASVADVGRYDGVGGHVHIGRRRPGTPKIVDSLDGLTRTLSMLNVFDSVGQVQRAYNTHYGQFGDYRPQVHGFEYRTMPTWIHSPWATYLTLVLSKLAVVEDFVQIRTPRGKPERVVYNLLRAYQNVDDDARIALIALHKFGVPQYLAGDFKHRWNIRKIEHREKIRRYIPPTIKPDKDSIRELFEYFTHGVPIPSRAPKPTWEPYELPENLNESTSQLHVYGPPDVAMGLIGKDCFLNVVSGRGGQLEIRGNNLSGGLIRKKFKLLSAWKGIQLSISAWNGKAKEIRVAVPSDIYNEDRHEVRKDMLTELREFLTDPELFPIAKYRDYKELLARKIEKKKELHALGKIVSEIEGGM